MEELYDDSMSKRSDSLAQLLKMVANPTRLLILEELKRHNARTVRQLVDASNVSYEGISNHLRLLRTSGIIKSHKRGLSVGYTLNLKQDPVIQKIIGSL